MAKRGSITIFFALVLSLLVSLVCTSIESVRMAAARTQILNSVDIGLYSLFGQYDRMLLEDYDLFLLDGSCGGETLDMASVYDKFESYMKPVLRQNSQKLSIVQGGFSGYRLLTDENGEVFYQQVVRYMQETLGSQGIQLLMQRMKERERQTKEAEAMGEQTENGNALDSYDSEINSAAEKSQAAAEEQNSQRPGEGSGEFGDGQTGGEDFASTPEPPKDNPITVIRRIMRMGLLELVIPGGRGISDNSVSKNRMVSGRKLQKGMPMDDALERDGSYPSQLMFQQYLLDKLGNYMEPAIGGLRYQIEYILGGKDGDLDNLRTVAKKLLLIREGVNFAHLLADGSKRSQAGALATAIASGFLIPPAAVVIEGALLLCWAFAESVLDVRELFAGGKIPLVKNASQWQLSLENLPYLLDGLDSVRRSSDDGMTYEDYLQIMLLGVEKETKVKRAMDMVELSVRTVSGREGFCLDHCIAALEMSVDVRANRRKVFNVTRKYAYE